MTWWRSGVLYQIYPRSFGDSDGDGTGDLRGVLEHLDHLRGGPHSLGVDGVWLTPIYPSPQYDYGYDVSDYCAIDPVYGDLRTFDQLVADAHARGLRVLLDLVPGHTSVEHPWFQAARSSRSDPFRDWYIWADPAPDGGPPNGWIACFGGSMWTWDADTGQYYLHSFYAEQPDLNWRNPAVTRAFEEITAFWLGRGVDGFRVDAIDRAIKDEHLRENPFAASGMVAGLPERGSQFPLWTKGRPEVLDVVRGLRRAAESARPGSLLLGEAYVPIERLGRFLGDRVGDAFDLVFDFDFLFAGWDADRLRLIVECAEAMLPAHGWPCRALSNHDNSRHSTRFGAAANRGAAMLLLTLRGTPVLYMGEEIGMADVPPPGVLLDRVGRDAQRTPMQWTDAPGGGFTTGRPWLALGDTREVNVAAQRDDPGSLLTLYRRLIDLRAQSPALGTGTYRALDVAEGSGVLAYLRESEEQRLLIALDVGGTGAELDLPAFARGRIGSSGRLLLSTGSDGRPDETIELSHLVLEPGEGILVEL